MEESEQGGSVDVAPSDTPPCIYQQQAALSITRTVRAHDLASESTPPPLPRLINAKRKNERANRQASPLRSGEKRSDEHVKGTKATHGSPPSPFLNAYPLCPGYDEARDHRRRGISFEISAGERTRKRSTGPNVQPKLTGHFVR